MDFKSIDDIKSAGFVGFKSIKQLSNDYSSIPDEKGVYMVITPSCNSSEFLQKGTGGYFKDKDPNVSLSALKENWIANCPVLYIGKAGGGNSSATLRKRLRQYLQFGQGKPAGHYGGRLIWQVKNNSELLFAWKGLSSEDPRTLESELLSDFECFYGRLPFANLTR